MAVATDRAETARERWARLGFDREATVEGVRLHYVEAGTGPSVFLLHGMGDCAIAWRYLLEPLAAAGFRAIAWDMMGSGLSEKPIDRAYSMPAMATLFDAFRRSLGVERAALVGNSYGGGVALLQAWTHPETVSALVLLDPACYADGVGKFTKVFKNPLFAKLLYPLVPARQLARLGLRQCADDFDALPPELLKEYTIEARRPGTKSAFARFEQDVVPEDPRPFEKGHRFVRAPTLIVWGRRDRVLPLRHGERLARAIRGSRLLVVESAHIPHLEHPAETNPAILGFLREVYGPAPNRRNSP